jgi:hypothetical protein
VERRPRGRRPMLGRRKARGGKPRSGAGPASSSASSRVLFWSMKVLVMAEGARTWKKFLEENENFEWKMDEIHENHRGSMDQSKGL